MDRASVVAEPPARGGDCTYEDLIDLVIARLRARQMLPAGGGPTPWDAFVRSSDAIHSSYEVPHTTVTPVMRRLLFGLACAVPAATIVGVGTYVGYAFSWILGHRGEMSRPPAQQWHTAVGFDVDSSANVTARRNCSVLGHGERLAFVDGDGVAGIGGWQQGIDMLFIDLDDPIRRKRAYRDVLEAALPRMRPGSLVLAHDPCVRIFRGDFAAYDSFVVESGSFVGPLVLPVDASGLSLATVR